MNTSQNNQHGVHFWGKVICLFDDWRRILGYFRYAFLAVTPFRRSVLVIFIQGQYASTGGPWASINRGVLLCDECSSIHRQLGRHISQIKHLKKSRWRPSQLSMVRYLASAGANGYWEHILFEPMLSASNVDHHRSSKSFQPHKKPLPTDPVHPTKADFIREKYLFLGFFKKPRNINQDDLNQQLHASVRTGVLETSLYLLALGANPNFIHPTKGTAPIHVACQYGQIGQVELLLAYGADVCIRDSSGKTVIDLALDKALALNESMNPKDVMKLMRREEKLQLAWSSMVDVLVSAYYDLTDSLAYFLTRHIPDHKAAFFGLHNNDMSRNTSANANLSNTVESVKSPDSFISSSCNHDNTVNGGITNGHFLISTSLIHESNGIPVAPKSTNLTSGLATPTSFYVKQKSDQEDWIIEARERLSKLSNLAFSDLCIDVYDEADRRLTNSFLENPDTFKDLKHLNNYTVFNGCHNEDGVLQTGVTSKEFTCVPTPPPHKVTLSQTSTTTSPATNLTLFFLPPNTTYSSIRNQARQKLGRLSTIEFHTLTLDVLTEASVRLLPLFLPLTHVNTVEISSAEVRKSQHSYTDYFNATEHHNRLQQHHQKQQLNDFVVSHRKGPLPSLPTSDAPIPNLIGSERIHSTSNSSNDSLCVEEVDEQSNHHMNISLEDLSDKEHSQLTTSSPVLGKAKKTLTKKSNGLGRSRDDPVYDQVAGEVELNEDGLRNSHTIVSSSSTPPPVLSVTDQTTLSVNVQTLDMINEDNRSRSRQNITETVLTHNNSNSSLSSPLSPSIPEGNESSHHRLQKVEDNVEKDGSDSIGSIPHIISCPGPVPGSRRLHLSHTGRLVQHRASVPTASGGVTITTTVDNNDIDSNPVSLTVSTMNIMKSSEPTETTSTTTTTLHSLINPCNTDNNNSVVRNYSPHSHTYHQHHPEPCCIAARNEVERLRKENAELKTQLFDLQSSKDIVEQRLEDLEGRMIQLDSVVQSLKEEKSALLAAFSAGMVMVHNPLKSCHPKNQSISTMTTTTTTTETMIATINSPQLKDAKSIDSNVCGKVNPISHQWDYEKEEEGEEDSIGDMEEVMGRGEHGDEADVEQYKDDDSEYDMERVGGDKSINESNYAVGSHCLDSGVLLRQGIILRGSRGESPASLSGGGGGVKHHSGFGHPNTSLSQPTVTPSFHSSVQSKLTGNHEGGQRQSSVVTSANQNIVSSTSQNIPTYINAPNLVQHPLPKSRAAVVSNAAITLAEASSTDIPDDYTAPNTTGSPSPAPLPVSQGVINTPNSHRIATSCANMNIPGSQHHHHHLGKSTFIPPSSLSNKPNLIEDKKNLHHTEVLVSISKSSPDYDNASRSSSSSASVKTNSLCEPSFQHHIGKSSTRKYTGAVAGIDRIWKAPSSERVVRCVETIIMRIRNLVELANGDRRGNSAQCSRLIQSAVQELLNLFPKQESRPTEVENALNDLATESYNLRQHCEKIVSTFDSSDRFEI
ncbi:unnamed protein product, partial [Heterobilharzia americana]